MDFNEFSKIVDEKMVSNPIWFGLESDSKSTDDDITEIENSISIILPQEYKQFVKNYGGGYFAFTNVFSGIRDSEWYIVTQNIEAGFNEANSFIAVSDNGTGDFYGFEVNDGKCESKISFYDHEDNTVKTTQYSNLFDYLVKVGLNSR